MHKLIKKDLKYLWHPYTQMKEARHFPPVLIKKAKGIRLYDEKGNFYYDTISSWWCNVHGHSHPKIKRAVKKQLDMLDHVLFAGFTHEGAVRLAEKLVGITPKNLTKVFFSDNGSTAVETALKMSFQYWQNIGRKKKKKFISLDYGYHGDTLGAMSVSSVDLFNKVFSPLFFKTTKIQSPYCYRCPVKKESPSCRTACIKPLENSLKTNHEKIAAFILEPIVMAAGGMIVYPPEYLKKARRLTRKYNVHLIADEVATGFGRTGKMFALEHAKIQPDFMCLSKGLTSGTLPMAATLTTEKVYRAFLGDYEKRKTFYHGHTYAANPISSSAALASLEVFEEEDTLRGVRDLIPVFHKELEKFRKLPFVGDVRRIGMIGALELVKDKKRKTPFGLKEKVGLKIYENSLKENLILRPLGNIIYLYLPLCIKKAELMDIMRRAYRTIKNSKISA